jgi:hypothetical protein
MMNLKQSPIFTLNNNKISTSNKLSTIRSKAFDEISKFTINDPFTSKKNTNSANL